MIESYRKMISREGVESEHPGRESKQILQPDNLFLNNINDYRFNRFLSIGMNILIFNFIQYTNNYTRILNRAGPNLSHGKPLPKAIVHP